MEGRAKRNITYSGYSRAAPSARVDAGLLQCNRPDFLELTIFVYSWANTNKTIPNTVCHVRGRKEYTAATTFGMVLFILVLNVNKNHELSSTKILIYCIEFSCKSPLTAAGWRRK